MTKLVVRRKHGYCAGVAGDDANCRRLARQYRDAFWSGREATLANAADWASVEVDRDREIAHRPESAIDRRQCLIARVFKVFRLFHGDLSRGEQRRQIEVFHALSIA